MDASDEKIIQLLREDSRRSLVEIGSKIGLSEAAVRRRVNKLMESKIIKKFTVEVEEGGASAITLVSVSASTPTPQVSAGLKKIKGVEVIYEITGQYDIAVLLRAPSIADINRFIDDIRLVEGVVNTNTVIILRKIS